MVPAADFPEDAETKLQANSSEQTKSECTFTMANISPQVHIR